MLDGLLDKVADAPQFAELKRQVAAIASQAKQMHFMVATLAELELSRDPQAYAKAASKTLRRIEEKP